MVLCVVKKATFVLFAMLLITSISKCDRDWSNQEVVYDDCEENSKNLQNEVCCPINLRYSHPRVLMKNKGCDCYCGVEKESLFGANSWTRKYALRTLASIQDVSDEENNAEDTGNVAASLNAVDNFKIRKESRNTTADAKSEAARIQANQLAGTTDFLGHTPTREEAAVLRKVIDEWEEQKTKIANVKGSGSNLSVKAAMVPSFSEFAGPELMSLYMDKARAAMLSERDVRDKVDEVVEGMIRDHLKFRNDELEWSDRQASFNDLLAHAENYLQYAEPGRAEDRVNMGSLHHHATPKSLERESA